MGIQEIAQDELISLLAHRPRHIIDGMIRITELPALLGNWQTSRSSSMGDFDALPIELLHAIFALLDLKTLSDISRTCLRGAAIVKSLREYHDLMQYAPQALIALSRTKLIRYHAAATVHSALRSSNCASCGKYGAFLFLPACQRCCNFCLRRNQSLWVVPISTAKKCFGLSAAKLKGLPIMRNIPGKYYVRHSVTRQRSIKLVCVGAAKKLASAENISEWRLRQNLEDKCSAGLQDKDYCLLRFLHRAPLTPPGPNFWIQPTEAEVPNDAFCGMAAIYFPHLAQGKLVESGFWCLGCEAFCRRWSPNHPVSNHVAELLLPGCRAGDIVYNMQEIARSRAEFLRHVHQCPGAKELYLRRKVTSGQQFGN